MDNNDSKKPSADERLPIAPSLKPALNSIKIPQPNLALDRSIIRIVLLALLLGLVGGLVAQGLMMLIGLITNLAFYGSFSADFTSPADNHLGIWVIVVPVIGAIVVGFMAYYGSKAIRGHGIPEAMEQILINQSRISPRLMFLKPVSSAITIGTGGPFGAEGPIIATGGALGSFVSQLVKTTADERKTLLAAGAAAGMSATFGSPVSAVLLAVELLLFEFRSRSIIPVAIASVAAAAVRIAFFGTKPIFEMPDLIPSSASALASYVIIGAVIGVISVYVTRAVYAVEDTFAKLPIHWMWWPALGAIPVGIIGYFSPHTLGVGYDNIDNILSGHLIGLPLLIFAILKFTSWVISLGSGTSGGTLAPLFTIGGGIGALLGSLIVTFFPHLGVDPRIAALVGMAAMFAGASRAMLASAVFAFETTLQPIGILPLLGGCTAAYLMSSLLMKNSIMTEKIARRGVRVPSDYSADTLDQLLVRDSATYRLITLRGIQTIEEVRAWMSSGTPESSHQGFPVLDDEGKLLGVVTRRGIFDIGMPINKKISEIIKRSPVILYEENSLREAFDLMAQEGIGRLPVVTRKNPDKPVAILSRSDILSAKGKYLEETQRSERYINRWSGLLR